MRHPIQHLHACAATSRLYTATSNSLHAFDAAAGTLLASWAAPAPPEPAPPAANPAKKRKVEDVAASPQQPARKERDKTRITLLAGIVTNNAISKVLTTGDGRHVVVATGEDKAVTVLDAAAGLKMLSKRTLPKRIVDLALAEDGKKILCADKFGDVFALPLLPSASDMETPSAAAAAATEEEEEEDDDEGESEEEEAKDESEERKKLKKQRAYAEREQAAAERRKRLQVDYNIPFTHDFVLGHVSMLLSLLTVTMSEGGRDKTWVITSDRDEHIRVTRYPQSFVIEGFCLGHTQFVKAMLAPSWNPESLVSGGGDEFLFVWNWREQKIQQKVDLVAPVQRVLGEDAKMFVPRQKGDGRLASQEDIGFKFAVSGLWEVPGIAGILVGIESVPALFLFLQTADNGLVYTSTLTLPGNFLSAAVSAADNKVFVSVDPADAVCPLLGVYFVDQSGEWTATDEAVARGVEQSVVEAVDIGEDMMTAIMPNVIYPVASLRKD